MDNKRAVTIIVILIALAIIVVAGYKLGSSYMWSKDGNIHDGHTELIENLKNEQDQERKEEKVQLLLDAHKITQAEADEILNK